MAATKKLLRSAYSTRFDPRQQPPALQTRAPKLAAGNPTHGLLRGEQTQHLCAYYVYAMGESNVRACISLTCFYIRDLVFRAQNMLIEMCCNVQLYIHFANTDFLLSLVMIYVFLEHATVSIYAPNLGTLRCIFNLHKYQRR